MLNGLMIKDNIEYNFSYDTKDSNERLDIYLKGQNYSPLNTGNINSYIKTNGEAYLGDKELIDSVLSILKSSFTKEDRCIEDARIKLTLTGKDITRTEFINMSSGDIERIVIDSNGAHIEAIVNKYSSVLDITPLNLSDYIIIGAKKIVYDKGVDIRSLDYLRANNPYIDIILKRDYVVVKSMDDFYSRFDEIVHNQEDMLGIDIETTGLGVNYMQGDYLTGVILSNKIGKSTYFPFRQDAFKFNLDEKYIKTIFDTVANQRKDVLVAAHNGVMEIKGFYKELHKKLRVDVDTMQLSIMINPMFNADNPHDLKSLEEQADKDAIEIKFKDKLSTEQLESVKGMVRYIELSDIFVNKKQIDFSKLTEDIAQAYACPDGDGTIKVFKHLIGKLPGDERRLFNLESKVQAVKAENEFYGLRLDIDKLTKYRDEVEAKKNFLEELFHLSVDDRRSITASKALVDIIYRKLNAPVLVITKTEGKPAVNKTAISAILRKGAIQGTNDNIKPIEYKGEVLIKAKDLNNKYYPLVILQAFNLLEREYRTINRMLSLQVNGRIPFYIKAIGASSERQSGDAQQYATRQKACVLSDSKYHDEYSCDYKQIELRILASEAGEKFILDRANDPDSDLHRIICSGLENLDQYLITSEKRSEAKSMNFGIVYMMSDYGLAKKLFGVVKPTDEQVDVARNRRTDFFNTYSKIKKYLMDNEEFIVNHGYVKTKWGWYRYAKEILNEDIEPSKRASIIRQLNNTPIQGYGAALLKLVETNIQKWIQEKGWDKLVDCDGEMLPLVRMMLPIHDEILVSAHRSIPTEEILRMFKYCFEVDIKGACKYFAAPALVSNWADGKDDAYEIPIRLRDRLVEEYEKTGVSKINHENWLTVLNTYRSDEVIEWFNNLINESENFNDLCSKITHPNLTHTLISLALNKDETKVFKDQLDRIKLAAYKYITGKSKSEVVTEIDDTVDITTFKGYVVSSESKSDELKVSIESEDLYSLEQDKDSDGNIIDEVIVLDSSDLQESIKEDGVKPVVFMNQAFINDSDIKGNVDDFVLKLKKYEDPESDYQVYIVGEEGARYICNMDYKNIKKIGG